jgi:hypothetical protein
MSRVCAPACLAVLGTMLVSAAGAAQTTVPAGASAQVPPAPATKLEAFKPAAGTVVTFGYNELGQVGAVSVDARELRDTKGDVVRGVAVEVTESEYRRERAFVDSDELPELLKGIDALLGVKANPTSYQNFEVRYTTKGELQIAAFSGHSGGISYAVQAGRLTTAQAFMDEDGLRKLRTMFEVAGQQLGGRAARN